MTETHETATVGPTSPTEVARVVKRARGLRAPHELDAKRASRVHIGDRRWLFVLTKGAVAGWDVLGSSEVTVGVLIYEQSGSVAPFAHREIAVRPGQDGLVVEVREGGIPRWVGTGRIDSKGTLVFSVPIDRDGGTGTGVMAGRLGSDGALTFSESRLPKPLAKRVPVQVGED